MRTLAFPAITSCLLAFWIVLPGHSGAAWALDRADSDPLHAARAAVNHAWEVYHRAALSGTLESPALQISIEKELREARAMLAEAETRRSESRTGLTTDFLDRIRELTDRIITQSQRRRQ